MTHIHRILAATDFSAGAHIAVERAVQIAQAHGASIDLLHAFDVSAWHGLKGIFDVPNLTIDPPADVQARQQLMSLAASLATQTSLKIEACFGEGSAAQVIGARVKSHGVSLVVLGAHSEPDVAGLGSTALKIARDPPCPVLIARCGECHSYQKVLTAVDMSDTSLHTLKVATQLFPAAHHHVLFAIRPRWNTLPGLAAGSKAQLGTFYDAMRGQAARQLEGLVNKFKGQLTYPVIQEIVDDIPARAIPDRAKSLPADCVAVGHHGQGSGVKSDLGSMAQIVLHHTERDVLVVSSRPN